MKRNIRLEALGLGRLASIVLLSFWGACQSGSVEQPTLTDDKLAKIMADLSVADAATTGLSGFSKDSLMQVYFKQVFELHNTNLGTYEKDLRILANDLPRMERIVKQADELLTEHQ
jgi:hypothetical protein